MKLRYLGTAAAEGWPGVFCNCDYCKKAKELGGKNIRSRSQTLINDDLLIDFPVDTYYHFALNKLDLSKVKYCFVTHSHIDHFAPIDLIFRVEGGFSHMIAEPIMKLFGNERVLMRYDHFITKTAEIDTPPQTELCEIKAYQPIFVDGYKVTPLPANHAPKENAFVFLVEQNGKVLLYLNDTGLLSDDVYDYLKSNNIRADLISYDCTYVIQKAGGGHLGFDTVQIVRDRLSKSGIADENTKHIVTHFSHNGFLLHDELAAEAEKLGFIAAFDGMEIEI